MIATLFYDAVQTDEVLCLNGEQQASHHHSNNLNIHSASPSPPPPQAAAAPAVTPFPLHAPQQPSSQRPCAHLHSTLGLPELEGCAMWWTTSSGELHLLLTNNQQAATRARSSQCRLLPIQLPVRNSDELLTCGVSASKRDPQQLTVAWVTRDLRCGAVVLRVFRDGGSGSNASGHFHHHHHLTSPSSPTAFSAGGGLGPAGIRAVSTHRCEALLESLRRIFDEEGEPRSSQSGCVLSLFSARGEEEDREVAAVFFLTNGTGVWRVTLRVDGSAIQEALADPRSAPASRGSSSMVPEGWMQQENEYQELSQSISNEDNSAQRPLGVHTWESLRVYAKERATAAAGGHQGGWLRNFLEGKSRRHGNAAEGTPSRRYLCVAAIQNSPWFAVLRWDGMLEYYNGTHSLDTMEPMWSQIATSCLQHVTHAAREGEREGMATHFTMSARFFPNDGVVDVMTAFRIWDTSVSDSVCRSQVLWTTVSAASHTGQQGELIALRNTVEVTPPSDTAVLLSSTSSGWVDDDDDDEGGSRRRLMLLWSVEHGSSMTRTPSSRSLAALLQNASLTTTGGPQTLLQSVVSEATDVVEVRQAISTSVFYADGGRLRAFLTIPGCNSNNNGSGSGGALAIAVETYLNRHRLHAVESATQATTDLEVVMERVMLPSGSSSSSAELSWRFPSKGLRGLHLIPCEGSCDDMEGTGAMEDGGDDGASGHNEEGAERTRCDIPMTLLHAVLRLLKHHENGGELFTNAMRQVLTRGASLSTLSCISQMDTAWSEACPWMACMTAANVLEALRFAFYPPSLSSTTTANGLCYYSRYYIYHRVSRSLLHRLAYVTCLYIGWRCRQHHAGRLDPVTPELLFGIQYLSSAYFASQLAGPQLVMFGARMSASTPAATTIASSSSFTSDDVDYYRIVLSALLPGAALDDAAHGSAAHVSLLKVLPIHCEAVARGFQSANHARCHRACGVWCMHLCKAVPILQHYLLLEEVEAGRCNQTHEIFHRCSSVMEAISALPREEVGAALLKKRLLLTDAGRTTLFSEIRVEELVALASKYPEVAPKLYAVGLLRRLMLPKGALCLASPSTVSSFFLMNLLLVLQCAEGEVAEADPGHPSPAPVTLLRALKELAVDTYLFLAMVALQDGEVTQCIHYVENVNSITTSNSGDGVAMNREAEMSHVIRSAVHRMWLSPATEMDPLLSMPCAHPQVEAWIVQEWTNHILRYRGGTGECAGMKREEERTRLLRFIGGLHQFLMARHAYGQCGRVLSNITTHLRCSPWGRQYGHAVAQLTAMALHAVECISTDGSPTGAATAWNRADALSRLDLPWLKLRVYQAQCELKLWARAGSSAVDCVDLWVDGAPAENTIAAIVKFHKALSESRLWLEAFQFSMLAVETQVLPDSLSPPCDVLKGWVSDLVAHSSAPNHKDQVEASSSYLEEQQWKEFLLCCAKASTFENQYQGFDCAVYHALLTNYARTPVVLLETYAEVSLYGALKTLLRVLSSLYAYASYLRQQSVAGLAARDEEGEDNDERNSTAQEEEEHTLHLCCVVCVDSVHIAMRVLETNNGDSFTAGVFDGLARAIQSLQKTCPSVLAKVDAEGIHKEFLSSLTDVLSKHALP